MCFCARENACATALVISGVILFPGAGTNANHHSLVAIENHLKQSQPNLNVRRVDFAYRIAGKSFPDRAPVLVKTVQNAVLEAAKNWNCATNQIVIGGRSMGRKNLMLLRSCAFATRCIHQNNPQNCALSICHESMLRQCLLVALVTSSAQ
ncbi:MAG: hypothetical protein EBT42_02220 [Actinobacteria bacterium]|nr:hypothetical protein [Actinomycetota bacterium]